MCEIFVKRNGATRTKESFPLSEVETARRLNSDGAGFCVFSWDGRRWHEKETRYFAPSSAPKYGTLQGYYAKGGVWKEWIEWENDTPVVKAKSEEDNTARAFLEGMERLGAREMFIGHFRLATSGMTTENTQPIHAKNCIVIHNGIFSGVGVPSGFSDTKHFTESLSLLFENANSIKKEKKALSRALKQAGGSFSVFVYSKKSGSIYYRKSETTSFFWGYGGTLGATRSERFPLKLKSASASEVIIP